MAAAIATSWPCEWREPAYGKPPWMRMGGDMEQAVEQLREASKSNDAETARLAVDALQRLGRR